MRVPLFVSWFAFCEASLIGALPTPDKDSPREALPPIFVPSGALRIANSGSEARPGPIASVPCAVSPEMAEKLAAVVVRRAPPQPPPSAGGLIASDRVERGSSEVVQLAPYIVEEKRLRRLTERELLTGKGMLELARRRYPGLGPLGDAAALQRLGEDFAKERRDEMAELGGLFEIGGKKLPPALKQKLDRATRSPNAPPREFEGSFRLPK